MKPLRLFFVFCALVIGCAAVASDTKPESTSAALGTVEDTPQFKEMKARAERAEVMAEYWKAIAERNELAIRLMQSEAQLAEAKGKLESLVKKP